MAIESLTLKVRLKEIQEEYPFRSTPFLREELKRLESLIDFRLERFPIIRGNTPAEEIKGLIDQQKESLEFLRAVHGFVWDTVIDRTIRPE